MIDQDQDIVIKTMNDIVIGVVEYHIGLEILRLKNRRDDLKDKSSQKDIEFLQEVIAYVKENLK